MLDRKRTRAGDAARVGTLTLAKGSAVRRRPAGDVGGPWEPLILTTDLVVRGSKRLTCVEGGDMRLMEGVDGYDWVAHHTLFVRRAGRKVHPVKAFEDTRNG